MKKQTLCILITCVYFASLVLLRVPAWQNLDETIALYFIQNRSIYGNVFFDIFTRLASNVSISIIICIIVILSIIFKKQKIAWLYLFTSLFSALINTSIKLLVKRSRPPYNPLHIESSFSFPSGHSCAIFSLIGLSILLLSKSQLKKGWKYLSYCSGLIIIILIGISRLYLGVHWFTDILAGYATALYSMGIILLIYPDYTRKKE